MRRASALLRHARSLSRLFRDPSHVSKARHGAPGALLAVFGVALRADKRDYKKMAAMLENTAGLPIEVSAKDAHFLSGFNTKVVTEPVASK